MSDVGEALASGRRDGEKAQEISNRIVAICKDHLGRGPTKARTTIADGTVLCILEDSLIRAERSLVEAGKSDTVRALRRAFQEAMEAEMCAAVAEIMGVSVVAFMSANHIEPDYMAEIFVLEGAEPSRGGLTGLPFIPAGGPQP